jgi:hypothetical protein
MFFDLDQCLSQLSPVFCLHKKGGSAVKDQSDKQEIKDFKVLAQFTAVYCRAHHQGAKRPLQPSEVDVEGLNLEPHSLCEKCREFLAYAIERRQRCPLDPKPSCKHCEIHCYRPGHREQVREIMRFSGRRLMLRGRLDLLWHYFS